MIVDRKDHVQYLTVSKSYSDDCTYSLTKHNLALNNLYYVPVILYIGHYRLIKYIIKHDFKNSD